MRLRTFAGRSAGALLLAACTALPLAAQQTGRVTGVVTQAESGQPLAGVQVFVQGTQAGSLTGANGRFVLEVPAGTYTVVAQSIGYSTARQPNVQIGAGGTVTLNFRLQTSVLTLEGIVATGVTDPTAGVKLPFSIGTVSAENLKAVPATASALQALQGKVAGAYIVRSSGQPGSGVNVLLRTPTSIVTSNAPMYVVDGVILQAGTVDIESLDIESIEVIKGAAAASLYGSRAASGVIAIKTSRGKNLPVGSTRVNLRNESGVSFAPNDQIVNKRHAWLTNERGEFVDRTGNVTTDPAQRVADPRDILDKNYVTPLFDNISAALRPASYLQNSVSLSQNLENTNFYINLSDRRENATLVNNDGMTLRGVRVNIDHSPRSNLHFGANAFHSRYWQDGVTGTGISVANPFWQLLLYTPEVDLTKRDENGKYLMQPDPLVFSENPLWRQSSRDIWAQRARTLVSGEARFSPISWFTFEGNVSYDRSDRRYHFYLPKGTPLSLTTDQPATGALEHDLYTDDGLNASVVGKALWRVGDLTVRPAASALMERNGYVNTYTYGSNFAVIGVPTMGAARDKTISSTVQEVRANSYYTTVGLDYGGKYILDALVRRDGSSLFGANERWQTYYRVAGAYRLSEEPWFSLPGVSEFKLRGSHGTAGGRPGFSYQYETWSVNATTGAISKGTLGNRDLRPEFTVEQEYGIDMILRERYQLELTYAKQVTDGQIIQLPQPALTGYSSQWFNTGQATGTTYEATLNAQLLTRRNFSWNATVVADRPRSKISEWNRPCYFATLRNICGGASLAEMWGERFLRSADQLPGSLQPNSNEFQTNDDGYLVWVGPNGDWKNARWGQFTTINGIRYEWGMPVLERDSSGFTVVQQIGSSDPDLNLGWLNNVRVGNVNLHAHMHAQIGGDVYNNTRQRLYQHNRHRNIDQSGKAEESKKTTSYYFALYNRNNNTSEFVEDGSFLKLRALSLTYRMPKSQMSKVGLGALGTEALSFGIIGRNLFTLSNYQGFDPEVGSVLQRYDSFVWPNTRQLTFTVDVSF